MSRRNLLILVTAFAVAYLCYVRAEQNPYARYLADGLVAVEQNSLEKVPNRELFSGAMEGLVGVLRRHGDPHSQFLPEEQADPLRSEIRQQFGGIGVRLGFEGEPPRLVIVGPPDPGGPAARANLLPQDRILSIDGQPTDKMSMLDVVRLMRGRPGTEVRLVIRHEHETIEREVTLVRELIKMESILGNRRGPDGRWQFLLTDERRIAHVRIAAFGDLTATELSRVLAEVVASGVEAVVLDLRDNAGGALDAAVAVCDLFLPPNNTVVETRGRNHELLHRYTTTRAASFPELPLVVLVNQNSASAAEIVAACLQDHRRATVVGERTYGKGTVQQLIPLEAGKSLLKLTWASFWRPSGVKINRAAGGEEDDVWGVAPNPEHELRLTAEEYKKYRKYRTDRDLRWSPIESIAASEPENDPYLDQQLQLAVDHLRGLLAGGR